MNSSFQYAPIYKPNQVLCGQGQTAIVTGWTVKQAVARHLDISEFAAIGNLYSPTRGISPLVRNLLANPHVRFLVVLNGTKEDRNAGACDCLLDFLHHGFTQGKSDTGRDCWVINSKVLGYIEAEISGEALEILRQSLEWCEVKSIPEAVRITRNYLQESWREDWGRPLVFPTVESLPNVLPGTRYGHRIEGKTIAETWVKILHRIKTTGTVRPTGYDGKWQELIDLMAVVTDEPLEFYFPEPNYLPVTRDFIQGYISQILDDSPHREGVKYTYGQRLRSWFGQDQIKQIISKLINEIDSASGVMSLWDVKDHEKGGSPCLNHLWVRVVENELSLTATLRSNDMFAAWPANAMGLRALQQHIRDKIAQDSSYDLRMGPLITISQSAHIYDDTWENVDQLIGTQYSKICNHRDFYDAAGNFLIFVENAKIVVQQTTPGSGEVIKIYSGLNARSLYRQIAQQVPHITAEHAMYLGTELQKAEYSLKEVSNYEQDAII